MPKAIYVQPDGSRITLDVMVGQSAMEASVRANLPGIVAECGGTCSCATCHVYVDEEWFHRLEPPTSIEADLLSLLPEARANSRLACQIFFAPELDGLTVYTPECGNNR